MENSKCFYVDSDGDIVYCELSGRIAVDEGSCSRYVEVDIGIVYRWVLAENVFTIVGERK